MSASDGGLDVPRLGRILALIAFVTAVFLFLAAEQLTGLPLQVGFIAIGSVGVVTAIVGVLISWASTIGAERPEPLADRAGDGRDQDGRPAGTETIDADGGRDRRERSTGTDPDDDQDRQ